MTPSSVHREGALCLGVAPYILQVKVDELGPGSLGALGLLFTGAGNGSIHDGRAVIGASHREGDGSGFLGESIQAGDFEGTGSKDARSSRGRAVVADAPHCGTPIYLALKGHYYLLTPR